MNERHKGTLIPVRPDLSPVEFSSLIYDSVPEGYENKFEYLLADEKYLVHENKVFLINNKLCENECNITIDYSNRITYDVMFSNENLKEVLEKTLKDKNV
jgi:hypothetical protein